MARRVLALVGFVVLLAPAIRADEPKGKVLKEVWEAAFLEGAQVGYHRSLFRELTLGDKGERKVIEASEELELNLIRFNQNFKLQFTIANHETPDGKVLAIVVQQELSKGQKQIRRAKVDGKNLIVETELNNKTLPERRLPWNDKAIGLYGEELLFKNRKIEPGAKFDFLKFEPELDVMITYHVELKDWEDVTLLRNGKKRLMRVEVRTDKVQGIELPAVTSWVDDKGETLKRQMQIPGLGQLVTYRTTRELALARGGKAPVDIGLSQLIRLPQAIQRPLDATAITYRIRLKDVEEPLKAFANDDRQQVKKGEGDALEVAVQGRHTPTQTKSDQPPPAEYLKSNHFVRCDDKRVKALALEAIAEETDPWKKALRIGAWVHRNLKNKNFSEAFATADQVARTLEGDCTEHSVLAAAMCRAVGVPARPAVGLVHVAQPPSMGYHMWLEVWIAGKWYGLDPTLGLGRVGAGHLKITDHHWNDTQSFTPLFPVTRILGKVQIEVAAVKYD